MVLTRPPIASLRQVVKLIWAFDDTGEPCSGAAGRERVLPTGEMHLVFRLTAHPLRLFRAAGDSAGQSIGLSIVGGVATTSYQRDVSTQVMSVGVQLHPGASQRLFGVPADELAGRHESLEALWGPAAGQALDRLHQGRILQDKMAVLESILSERLPEAREVHPAIAHALQRFGAGASVGQVVHETGWSHRRFIEVFRQVAGVTPKVYSRLMRFQRAVLGLSADPKTPVSCVALDAGYSDQPHFSREFLEFAGVTPGEYRALAPVRSHHVRLGPR